MKLRSAEFLIFALLSFPAAGQNTSSPQRPFDSESALQQLIEKAPQTPDQTARRIAVSQNGRIKPLGTFARETILFLTGSYRKWGLNATQLYLAISSFPQAPYAPLVEVRDVGLRKRLGYLEDKRFFSLADLESSNLENLAGPLIEKEQGGARLNESEKKTLETFSQMNLLRQMVMKHHFPAAVDFSTLVGGTPGTLKQKGRELLDELEKENFAAAAAMAEELVSLSRTQAAPEMFKHYLEKLDTELLFYDLRLFLYAGYLCLLVGLALILDVIRRQLSHKAWIWIHGVTLIPLIVGLGFRVYITQFAPVTNMYGTMIWVAFGVCLFSWLLYALYANATMSGLMLIGASAILFLTENIPLILSPDLDPVVAVLRSNFWLSTHVTTITISYAAFTIAMIMGNVTLVKSIWKTPDSRWIQEYSHAAYRMVQLGCFLLTVGIILGGVWADYSWGRFWGWDPKETWALIADMGFLVLLHARYIGWVTSFSFLALLPVAYLLVIMAWYGVNFILAAELHSYGFSSGGATAVAIFVSAQLLLIVASSVKYWLTTAQEN